MLAPNRPSSTQETQQRILDAAIELFSRNGYRGASLRDIARRAGLNEVTLFRYFPKKNDLFLASVETSAGRIMVPEELRNRLSRREYPEAVLSEIADFLTQLGQTHSETVRLISFAMLESGSMTEVVRRSLSPTIQTFSSYLALCMDKGAVRTVDPEGAVWMLILNSAFQFGPDESWSGKTPSVPLQQHLAQTYRAMWLHALIADSSVTLV